MSDTEPSVKGTRNVPPLQLEALRAGTIYNKSSSGSAPVVSKKKWLAKWSQEDADRQRLPNFNPFQEAAGQATSNVGGKSHVNGMSLCSSAPRSDLEVFRASALRNTTERCSITLGAGLASDTMAAHVEMQMQNMETSHCVRERQRIAAVEQVSKALVQRRMQHISRCENAAVTIQRAYRNWRQQFLASGDNHLQTDSASIPSPPAANTTSASPHKHVRVPLGFGSSAVMPTLSNDAQYTCAGRTNYNQPSQPGTSSNGAAGQNPAVARMLARAAQRGARTAGQHRQPSPSRQTHDTRAVVTPSVEGSTASTTSNSHGETSSSNKLPSAYPAASVTESLPVAAATAAQSDEAPDVQLAHVACLPPLTLSAQVRLLGSRTSGLQEHVHRDPHGELAAQQQQQQQQGQHTACSRSSSIDHSMELCTEPAGAGSRVLGANSPGSLPALSVRMPDEDAFKLACHDSQPEQDDGERGSLPDVYVWPEEAKAEDDVEDQKADAQAEAVFRAWHAAGSGAAEAAASTLQDAHAYGLEGAGSSSSFGNRPGSRHHHSRSDSGDEGGVHGGVVQHDDQGTMQGHEGFEGLFSLDVGCGPRRGRRSMQPLPADVPGLIFFEPAAGLAASVPATAAATGHQQLNEVPGVVFYAAGPQAQAAAVVMHGPRPVSTDAGIRTSRGRSAEISQQQDASSDAAPLQPHQSHQNSLRTSAEAVWEVEDEEDADRSSRGSDPTVVLCMQLRAPRHQRNVHASHGNGIGNSSSGGAGQHSGNGGGGRMYGGCGSNAHSRGTSLDLRAPPSKHKPSAQPSAGKRPRGVDAAAKAGGKEEWESERRTGSPSLPYKERSWNMAGGVEMGTAPRCGLMSKLSSSMSSRFGALSRRASTCSRASSSSMQASGQEQARSLQQLTGHGGDQGCMQVSADEVRMSSPGSKPARMGSWHGSHGGGVACADAEASASNAARSAAGTAAAAASGSGFMHKAKKLTQMLTFWKGASSSGSPIHTAKPQRASCITDRTPSYDSSIYSLSPSPGPASTTSTALFDTAAMASLRKSIVRLRAGPMTDAEDVHGDARLSLGRQQWNAALSPPAVAMGQGASAQGHAPPAEGQHEAQLKAAVPTEPRFGTSSSSMLSMDVARNSAQGAGAGTAASAAAAVLLHAVPTQQPSSVARSGVAPHAPVAWSAAAGSAAAPTRPAQHFVHAPPAASAACVNMAFSSLLYVPASLHVNEVSDNAGPGTPSAEEAHTLQPETFSGYNTSMGMHFIQPAAAADKAATTDKDDGLGLSHSMRMEDRFAVQMQLQQHVAGVADTVSDRLAEAGGVMLSPHPCAPPPSNTMPWADLVNGSIAAAARQPRCSSRGSSQSSASNGSSSILGMAPMRGRGSSSVQLLSFRPLKIMPQRGHASLDLQVAARPAAAAGPSQPCYTRASGRMSATGERSSLGGRKPSGIVNAKGDVSVAAQFLPHAGGVQGPGAGPISGWQVNMGHALSMSRTTSASFGCTDNSSSSNSLPLPSLPAARPASRGVPGASSPVGRTRAESHSGVSVSVLPSLRGMGMGLRMDAASCPGVHPFMQSSTIFAMVPAPLPPPRTFCASPAVLKATTTAAAPAAAPPSQHPAVGPALAQRLMSQRCLQQQAQSQQQVQGGALGRWDVDASGLHGHHDGEGAVHGGRFARRSLDTMPTQQQQQQQQQNVQHMQRQQQQHWRAQ